MRLLESYNDESQKNSYTDLYTLKHQNLNKTLEIISMGNKPTRNKRDLCIDIPKTIDSEINQDD
jgi:hypothetical protein